MEHAQNIASKIDKDVDEVSAPTAKDEEAPVFDGDALLARREEESLARITCPKTRDEVRKRRRCAEEIVVCEMLLRAWQSKHGMEADLTSLTDDELSDKRRVTMCYAAALEGVGRRADGIDALRSHLGVAPEGYYEEEEEGGEGGRLLPSEVGRHNLDASAALALAKLYFKDDRKDRAMAWCDAVVRSIRNGDDVSEEDASDAYHLAGWIRIHSDDHSGAYRLWAEGHAVVPGCETLARQRRKRACWDDDDVVEREEEGARGTTATDPLLLGAGAHGDGVFDPGDLEAFAVPRHNARQTPALALFREETQRNELVFRTRRPVLTEDECARVLEEVDRFHDECRGGRWGTVRHSSVKTTDVAVEDIPALRPWLRDLLRTRLCPLVRAAYPILADGSTPGEGGSRVRVHDAFIVRYDAEGGDESFSLPEHSDTSAVSFTVALNSRQRRGDEEDDDGDGGPQSSPAFEGGGTWFEALGDAQGSGVVVDADVGQAVAFAGPLRHAGYPVTRGVRLILVLFLYIDGFSYGGYLEEYAKAHGACNASEGEDEKKENCASTERDDSTNKVRPSGDMPGGFVVYNQTVELVGMLNRQVESVLD